MDNIIVGARSARPWLHNNNKSMGMWFDSGAMGTVRAFPKRSEGPKGKRWNCPRGVADVFPADAQWVPLRFVLFLLY
ncbi:MAG: hypothetical protein ACOYVK_05950 [Bacillota bacterium]